MRRIPLLPVIVFSLILTLTGIVALGVGMRSHSALIGIAIFAVLNVCVYRFAIASFPVRPERLTENDDLFYFDILTLYDVTLVSQFLHAKILPIPISQLCYKLFGAHLGTNTYPATSIISDPFHFVSAGDDVIFGAHSTITPHTYESNGKLTIAPIVIGNNVTIGVNSVILPGVHIGNNAIVAAGSLVLKDTRIGAGEVWAGTPARMLRDGAGNKV